MKTTPATSTRTPARARASSSWRRFIPYALGAALLLGLITALRPRPIEVEIGGVTTGPLTVSVLEEGKTRIRHRYIVSPPVMGFLRRVELRAGDRIETGKTVLATIQPQPSSFLDPRTRAEAEARLKGTEAATLQRESQLERAKVALDWAQRELDRAKDLKTSGANSKKEWEGAQNEFDARTRELHSAEFGLKVANFEKAQAEAALMQAKNPGAEGSDVMVIVAPVDGYVLNVFEESARVLTAGMQIMEVGDPTDLECEIELLSSDAVGVQPGADVAIEEWGGAAPLRGKVALVEPGGYTKISALGVEEQRVKVRVNFAEPFPPGHTMGDRFRVEARIVTWRSDRVLQLPTGALFRRGGDWMTFLYDGGKARLAKVEIAHNNGVAAEVRSGLAEGQRVLLHPPDVIADGSAVLPRGQ